MIFFSRKAEAHEAEELWPSALNPCPFNGNHGKKPGSTATYLVHDYYTTICNNCLWERLETMDKEQALKQFKPDLQSRAAMTVHPRP